jgi:hypothetical protein
MPLSELGGLARVAAGRKPFANELVSDGGGSTRGAVAGPSRSGDGEACRERRCGELPLGGRRFW